MIDGDLVLHLSLRGPGQVVDKQASLCPEVDVGGQVGAGVGHVVSVPMGAVGGWKLFSRSLNGIRVSDFYTKGISLFYFRGSQYFCETVASYLQRHPSCQWALPGPRAAMAGL